MQKEVRDNQAESFALRLREALERRGKRASATALEREFNLRYRGPPVSMHATRKWLQGHAVPTQDKLEVLAAWLDVPAAWLRWGVRADVTPSNRPNTGSKAAPASLPTREQDKLLNKECEHSLLQDWRLLRPRNQQLVRSMIELLLDHQKTSTGNQHDT
jgi:transcriptional regulator with XRE-family HTH domain